MTLAVHDGERPTEPPPAPVRKRRGQALALGGAAVISAVAALMAVWLWGQSGAGGSEDDASFTVLYEPLGEPSRADAGPAVLDGAASAAPSREAVRPALPASHEADSAPTAVHRTEPARAPRPAPAAGVRPAPRSTGLVVITEPAGARVTVNGVGHGAAPLTLGNLTSGTKRIRVSMTGYESEERIVAADLSQTRVTLRIQLRPVPGPRQTR